MTDTPRNLKLLVWPPQVRRGESTTASIDATNLAETSVTLHVPDTMVISPTPPAQPEVIGSGTFQRTLRRTVQEGMSGTLEIIVSDGHFPPRMGQCKVVD
jgi:hypothetical protein